MCFILTFYWYWISFFYSHIIRASVIMLTLDKVPLLLVRFTWCRTFTGIFLKISFLCFFARLLHLFLIFLWVKYFFLESYFKYLFILDLLNSLFRKDAWLPLIVFGFVDACSQKTYEKISVSLAYQSSVL